ncbi:MAG: DUF3578 domain-containing protein [Kiritimatiellia bacterium]
MNLKEGLEFILENWIAAKNEAFRGHKLADFFRGELPQIVTKSLNKESSDYIIKGSPGQGNWADVPWLAILNPVITNSTTHGVYPVFLFRSDASGVYLTLGQGTTEPIREYGRNKAWKKLSFRAKKIRDVVPELSGWDPQETDLRAGTQLGKSYQKPNIGFKFYASDNIPKNDELVSDLYDLLSAYKKVSDLWGDLKSFEDSDDMNELTFTDNAVNLGTIIEQSFEKISGQLCLQKSLLINIISGLATKQFLIFTGLSGSGKTKIGQAFSQWISVSDDQTNLVAVGADWTSNENLLGYPDALKEKSYRKPDNGVLDLILNAEKDPEHPYFLILDEMNLSHVERYFADFLSAMESGEPIHLHEDTGEDWDGVPAKLTIPGNLFVIGTVNVDETTYMFSPKVLDRANVIEFRVDRDEMQAFLSNPVKPDLESIAGQGAAYAKAFTAAAKRKDVSLDDELKSQISGMLMTFFTPLQEAGAEFGYRTAHEICRFMYFHRELSGEDWSFDAAMDAAVMQKLLPKLHGSKKKLGPVLASLIRLCLSESVSKDLPDPLKDEVLMKENAKYPVSLAKLKRMRQRLAEHGFTSFAEA